MLIRSQALKYVGLIVLVCLIVTLSNRPVTAAPHSPSVEAESPNTEVPPFRPAGGFDYRRTIGRRPIFTVDYWPGIPAVSKEGRPDMSSDFEHFKAYADPVTVRTLSGSYKPDPRTAMDGQFAMPDLLHISDAELRDWQRRTHAKLRPLLGQYRKAGIYSLDLQMFFLCSGTDASPDWYHEVPDWAECDMSGKPLNLPCLCHPKMYEIIDRTYRALSFLKEEPVFLGFHVENEPHLGSVKDLADYGGNPHTKRAFREFLKVTFSSVDELNRIAGSSFPSFDTVDVADENWLVRVMAGRFRATLVTGVYQTRLAALAKKHFPNCVTMTRLATGSCLREQAGKREIMGLDLAYLKGSQLDVISWSQFWHGKRPTGFGQLHVTGGLLRGTGKALGVTEPHVWRYGDTQYGAFRAKELQHFIYRGLFYNFRMFNLHSWDRQGGWAVYNEPFGAVYSNKPGVLRMVAQLRTELDRAAPYKTFGKPVMPDLRLLISRNARHYPGMGGWFYGNWLFRLCALLERTQLTSYEILEEQTGDVEDALQRCRGVVVADACLSERTRELLDDFVRGGGRLLVFGAPRTVGPKYEPAALPAVYPVAPQRENLAEWVGRDVPRPIACPVVSSHPVFDKLSSIKLLRPAPLMVKSGAQVLAKTARGEAAVSAMGNVVYLSGFPTEPADQRALLEGFQRWCDVTPPSLLISRFEHATVAQNWDSANHRRDGSVIHSEPYMGAIAMSGDHHGVIRELREDCPWLAYRRVDGRIVLEGVRIDPKDVKVFRKEAARELPHFENLPDTMGFSYWWAGQSHPIIGRFTVRQPTDVDARIVGGPWKDNQIEWFVVEIGRKRIACGKGRRVRFHVEPGKDYYLTAVLPNHPYQDRCPLCRDHAFE